MRTFAVPLLVSLLTAPVAASAADASLAKFGWFADMAGSCWSATYPDGKTQHTHCYTGQFGHFIRGKATLSGEHNGALVERFQGDSLFAWNEAERRIDYYIWGSDGSHGRHEASYADDQLLFPVKSKKDPSKTAFRSVWKRIDDTSFKVRREVPDGAGWKTEMTVVYRKSGAAR